MKIQYFDGWKVEQVDVLNKGDEKCIHNWIDSEYFVGCVINDIREPAEKRRICRKCLRSEWLIEVEKYKESPQTEYEKLENMLKTEEIAQ